ncbi:hypothetical protein [Mycobacterium sp. URHB0021]
MVLVRHAVMRVWSLVDVIPKALAFEKTDPAIGGGRRSLRDESRPRRDCARRRRSLVTRPPA